MITWVDRIVTLMWGCSSKPTQHLQQRAWLWARHRPTGLSLSVFHPRVLVIAEVASVFYQARSTASRRDEKNCRKALTSSGCAPAKSEENKICHCWLPWLSLWGTDRRTQLFLETGNCLYFINSSVNLSGQPSKLRNHWVLLRGEQRGLPALLPSLNKEQDLRAWRLLSLPARESDSHICI